METELSAYIYWLFNKHSKFDALNILIAISHNNPFDTHDAMSPAHALNKWRERKAIALVILLFLTPLTGFISTIENDTFADKEVISYTLSLIHI